MNFWDSWGQTLHPVNLDNGHGGDNLLLAGGVVVLCRDVVEVADVGFVLLMALKVLVARILVLLHVQVLDVRLDLVAVTLADVCGSMWTYGT